MVLRTRLLPEILCYVVIVSDSLVSMSINDAGIDVKRYKTPSLPRGGFQRLMRVVVVGAGGGTT